MEETKQKIQITYRGFDVGYWEEEEIYSTIIDELPIKTQSLKKCKEKIDKFLKEQIMNTPAILLSYSAEHRVVITSQKDGDVWVQRSNGARSKESLCNIYAGSEFNYSLLEEIEKYRIEISELHKSIGLCRAKLQKYKLKQTKGQ